MDYIRCARQTVSTQYRELVQEEIPALKGAEKRDWRFFQWLTMGCRVKDETGGMGILASREILADIDGASAKLRHNRYSGLPLLEAWQARYTPIRWTEYDAIQHKARVIVDNGFSEQLLKATRVELSTPAHQLQDRCYLVSGERYTATRVRQSRIEDGTAARTITQQRLDTAGCQEVQILADYLNNLPPARFTKMLQRLPDAYEVANDIVHPRRRERAYRALRAMADQPQQYYAPSSEGRTVRLFGHNAGLVSLPREVRKTVLQGYTSVDLKAAQLAIVATLWDVPSVKRFLHQRIDGRSIWMDLCEMLALPYTGENKRGVKQLVYAICFGGGSRRKTDAINTTARQAFPEVPDLAKRFMGLPMIADLYQARQRAAKEIEANQGGRDCFGNWIPLQAGYGKAASVLACQAQAVELRLLWPVVEVARTSDELDIVCWLFDGASLAFSDASKQARLLSKLQGKVQAVADELGILTELEVEQ